jgi:hypothetical protein
LCQKAYGSVFGGLVSAPGDLGRGDDLAI